jgi:DNA-binding transcriptional MocR family regulator
LPDGGLYLWCRLRGRLHAGAVRQHARAAAVGLVDGQAFYIDRGGEADIRVCFSSIPPPHADAVAERLLRSVRAVGRSVSPQRLEAVS